MFRAVFDNGLPIKPYESIDYISSAQNLPELLPFIKKDEEIIILDFEDIDKIKNSLQNCFIIKDQLWLDFNDEYLVCENLENKSIQKIKKTKTIQILLSFKKEDEGYIKQYATIEL